MLPGLGKGQAINDFPILTESVSSHKLYLAFRLNAKYNRAAVSWMGLQETMSALSDPTRREILQLLKNGKLSAGEIADHFSISNASISRHLSILKKAELVRDCRRGQFIYYEIDTTVLQDILTWISSITCEMESSHEDPLTAAGRCKNEAQSSTY